MTLEQLTPTQEKTEDLQNQIARLGRQLCNFANLNPSFKKGKLDYVSIEVTEAERTEVELPVDFSADDEEEDDELDSCVPESSFTYKFEAERQRYYDEQDGNNVQRAYAMFMFSVIGINKNVLMPEHLAEDVIGLPGKEAVREIGPVTLRATTIFKLSTGIGHFSVCDHAEYLDLDDDPLHQAPCSCENNVLTYIPDYEHDGDTLWVPENGIEQYPSLDLLEKSKNEVVVYDEIETAVEEWRDMIHIGEKVDLDVKFERIGRARHVLDNIQRNIWTQAGLTSKQQKTLRTRLAR